MDEDKQPFTSDIILYTSPSGHARIEVWYMGESFWLTQKRMAELFSVDVRTINEHLQNIFSSHELVEDSVIRKFRITAEDGKNYLTNVYNLDAIIAVGIGAHRLHVPGLCREPGRTAGPHEDGGLGAEARRVPAIQWV